MVAHPGENQRCGVQFMTVLARPMLNKPGVHQKNRDSRIAFIRGAWKQWLGLNANNLVWRALVIGNVLLASLLTRGRPMSADRQSAVAQSRLKEKRQDL
jgi:hypothetical protein